MTDIDKVLKDLTKSARSEPIPQVDVRARVIATLADRPRPASLDPVPIACVGLALTTAVAVLIAFWPAWQDLSEPWIAYLI
ncbi:MAG: hypothetical protein JNK90_16125 [Planctomycetaceae bacterium]|nr:hypothetical protein [Planctomycetaceae bacterium]